jgi:hypothetical protein
MINQKRQIYHVTAMHLHCFDYDVFIHMTSSYLLSYLHLNHFEIYLRLLWVRPGGRQKFGILALILFKSDCFIPNKSSRVSTFSKLFFVEVISFHTGTKFTYAEVFSLGTFICNLQCTVLNEDVPITTYSLSRFWFKRKHTK